MEIEFEPLDFEEDTPQWIQDMLNDDYNQWKIAIQYAEREDWLHGILKNAEDKYFQESLKTENDIFKESLKEWNSNLFRILGMTTNKLPSTPQQPPAIDEGQGDTDVNAMVNDVGSSEDNQEDTNKLPSTPQQPPAIDEGQGEQNTPDSVLQSPIINEGGSKPRAQRGLFLGAEIHELNSK